MYAIIAVVISVIGYVFCGIDFCTLYTLVGTALTLYENWLDYSNDKATRR